MSTGENDQMLRGVIDLLRLSSIVLLGLHFYIYCHGTVLDWGLTADFLTGMIRKGQHSPFFTNPHLMKAGVLGLLIVALIGLKGKKDTKAKGSNIIWLLAIGSICYWASPLLMHPAIYSTWNGPLYILLTAFGYILLLTGGARISRLIKVHLDKDVFNELNETFPQVEDYQANEYSINLPAKYNLKGKVRKSWINILAPFRATMIIGSGGAGKSYFIIRHYITQMISKHFTMFLYDFKWDDLSKIAYNAYLKYKDTYPKAPKFYYINFDEPSRTHRCNVIPPDNMMDIADAAESSRTLLLALNRDWTRKSGEFFIESPINFVTAVFWFLKKYRNGKYCTLPHAIEFMQLHYDDLFPILGTENEIEVLIG
ncbi:YWFCY domain-containing protein [Paraflavitalea devenefica]|uniref:YWFCY domain-containing protein n=1 Tax=Paraflavitalea devenefica TaxID=2716334 RepID=UPI001FEABAC6|nr:YWFCY domain-containing protein [Paraflavitalea devenefica]